MLDLDGNLAWFVMEVVSVSSFASRVIRLNEQRVD